MLSDNNMLSDMYSSLNKYLYIIRLNVLVYILGVYKKILGKTEHVP